MKRISILLVVLVLSGCSNAEPVAQKGEVISCESVSTDEAVAEGIALECVDSSPGAITTWTNGFKCLGILVHNLFR
jgi:PBP1b-binding outer membrane lipoprotein LpoB